MASVCLADLKNEGRIVMKSPLLAAALTVALATPAFPQSASTPAPAPAVVAETTEAPIPVPQEAPGGSSTPMGVSAGVGVGVVVLGVGLIIACGIACAN